MVGVEFGLGAEVSRVDGRDGFMEVGVESSVWPLPFPVAVWSFESMEAGVDCTVLLAVPVSPLGTEGSAFVELPALFGSGESVASILWIVLGGSMTVAVLCSSEAADGAIVN